MHFTCQKITVFALLSKMLFLFAKRFFLLQSINEQYYLLLLKELIKDDSFYETFESLIAFITFFTIWLLSRDLVCVTEQHCVSIFFTRLWSVRKPLLLDTQNPRFSTAHASKQKTKRQAKMKRDSRKMTFLLISRQATLVLEKHRCQVSGL